MKELTKNFNLLNLKRTEITNLLSNKESFSFINSDKMNLFTLEQLIDNLESSLLTWQQIKYIKGKKRKGQILSQFTKLEEKTLKEKAQEKYLISIKQKGQIEMRAKFSQKKYLRTKEERSRFCLKEKENYIQIKL